MNRGEEEVDSECCVAILVMSQDGDTPLQLATVRQETEMVEALLEAGAKPNEVQNKRTCLHLFRCPCSKLQTISYAIHNNACV